MLSNVNGYVIKPEWFIGKGSFGSVYKTEKDGKFFAIKIFQSELLQTEYRSRLDREIKAIQKISHPNVVKIHDFGKFAENNFEYFYIVMDLVEGRTLSEYIGVVNEDRCIKIIESILDTIDSIHLQGVLHRDLKPDNIMINSKGVPIILDFGLAKLIDYSSITQTGDTVGTFYYMSPEQITDSKHLDNRSDYFSIGVIFYQLLTGTLPHDAEYVPALIEQIKNQYPISPSELNSDITNQTENVILKLLEKEPYRRYQSAVEIIEDLKASPKRKFRKIDLSDKFYVRLLNNERSVFEDGIKEKLIDNVVFPANFFQDYKPTMDVLRKSGVSLSTDPATNRLTYTAFSKTIGLQKLPYSSGDEVTPIEKSDFSSITQIKDYVRKVLDYQVQNGITELSAPFFFAKSSKDEWFQINIKLLKESVSYRDQYYSKMPLWGNICMNIDSWHNKDEKAAILNQYVKTGADGFFIYGDPVGNQSNLTQLFHYVDLLRKLQTASQVPVIACRVNGLGLVLMCLGISGISSGISALDSFQESLLCDAKKDYGPEPRYYIPELMSLVSLEKRVTTKLIDIDNSSIGADLRCSCKYCAGIHSGTPLTQNNLKLHFLQRRKQEIEEIKNLPMANRVDYIDNKIDRAMEYSKVLSREGIKVGDFSHLHTWKDLVRNVVSKT